MAEMNGAPSAPPLGSPFQHFRHANQTLNAVSFGFIATAVLFAMFLVMAIFERIFRPHRSNRAARDEEQADSIPESSTDSQKPELSHSNSYSKAVSVLMPGQEYPTYFARPVPSPCQPERIEWPLHEESSDHDSSDKEALHYREYVQGECSASGTFDKQVSHDLGKGKGFQDVVKGDSSSSSGSSIEEAMQHLERNEQKGTPPS